jgi:thiol-disulfide isomerase/thioredoxin
MNRRCFAYAPAIVVLTAISAFGAPQIGEKAPAVKIAKWMNHQPPALPGQEKADQYVFVVEFWATWCRPCWASIPHLAELHKRLEKDGLVIIGVSNEEPETISKFMNSQKGGVKMEMPYFVGSDDDMATTNAWTEDVEGIPHAFVVNKAGLVVWQGNPLDSNVLDSVIGQVLAGKYDVEAAKKAAVVEKKFNDLMSDLQAAFATHQEDKMFKIVDEMISLKPDRLQPYFIRRQMLREFDKDEEVAAWNKKMLENFKDDAASLRQITEVELEADIGLRDATLLVESAARAAKLSKEPDAETLSILARVQRECGRLDAAIETQGEAVSLASKANEAEYKKVLEYYKTLKKLSADLPRGKAKAGQGA